MNDYLPCIEIEPTAEASASIIWLHGLGADGRDFEGIVPELHLPEDLAVRFIFPNAPALPITINNGYVMPAWFDILALGGEGERSINPHQLLASAVQVHKLIDREIERGVSSERIILAGFSQGGAVNYHAGLTYDKPLGGILALSTFFPTAESVTPHPASHGLPIQIFHGQQDPILNVCMAKNSIKYLNSLGFHPDYKEYAMEHSVCPEEIRDIAVWIKSILI